MTIPVCRRGSPRACPRCGANRHSGGCAPGWFSNHPIAWGEPGRNDSRSSELLFSWPGTANSARQQRADCDDRIRSGRSARSGAGVDMDGRSRQTHALSSACRDSRAAGVDPMSTAPSIQRRPWIRGLSRTHFPRRGCSTPQARATIDHGPFGSTPLWWRLSVMRRPDVNRTFVAQAGTSFRASPSDEDKQPLLSEDRQGMSARPRSTKTPRKPRSPVSLTPLALSCMLLAPSTACVFGQGDPAGPDLSAGDGIDPSEADFRSVLLRHRIATGRRQRSLVVAFESNSDRSIPEWLGIEQRRYPRPMTAKATARAILPTVTSATHPST